MRAPSHILSIIALFEETSVWTVEAMAGRLGLSVRTAYRHVRELTRTGFLDPAGRAGYVLGPAFIRYDRVIRQSDPLIGLAGPTMSRLLDVAGQEGAVLLCRRFRDCIMSVHSVEGQSPHPPTSYERGAAMSLFRGAPAKVLLASLPDRALRAIYLRREAAVREAGYDDWTAFRAQLRTIRREGVSVTTSEVGVGRIGIASPILRGDAVLASLCLVVSAASGGESLRVESFSHAVRAAAGEISDHISGCGRPGAA